MMSGYVIFFGLQKKKCCALIATCSGLRFFHSFLTQTLQSRRIICFVVFFAHSMNRLTKFIAIYVCTTLIYTLFIIIIVIIFHLTLRFHKRNIVKHKDHGNFFFFSNSPFKIKKKRNKMMSWNSKYSKWVRCIVEWFELNYFDR